MNDRNQANKAENETKQTKHNVIDVTLQDLPREQPMTTTTEITSTNRTTTSRSYSNYGREAGQLLGYMLRNARIRRRMSMQEVSERAGISRGLLHRIEHGDLGCSTGATFEVATIVGVRLFDQEPTTMSRHLSMVRDQATLLPDAVRHSATELVDDF